MNHERKRGKEISVETMHICDVIDRKNRVKMSCLLINMECSTSTLLTLKTQIPKENRSKQRCYVYSYNYMIHDRNIHVFPKFYILLLLFSTFISYKSYMDY